MIREFVKKIKEVLVEKRYEKVDCYYRGATGGLYTVSIGSDVAIFCSLYCGYFVSISFIHRAFLVEKIYLTWSEKRFLKKELRKAMKDSKALQKSEALSDKDLY